VLRRCMESGTTMRRIKNNVVLVKDFHL